MDFLELFLEECKIRIKAGKWTLIPRDKNINSIREMGLTLEDVKDIILDLETKDYYRGPTEDHKYKDEYVWEFLVYEDYTIYIKLKLDNSNGVVCLSFHESEW